MRDRPTFDELLAAVERFLEDEVMPSSEGARRFHARVAANTLRIVRRELANDEEQLAAEWEGLEALLGAADRPGDRTALREAIRERNGALCDRIRAGETDSDPLRGAVRSHVRRTVRDKLLVTNPGWLGEAP